MPIDATLTGSGWLVQPLVPGSGGGAFIIDDDHFFADDTARDVYFTAHPEEKTTGVIIGVGSDYEQWNGSAWNSVDAVVRGPAGTDGDDGDDGTAGANGVGAPISVVHNDAIDLTQPGFGKVSDAVIDLSGGARVLSLASGAVARGAYEVTFRGDGNGAHGVTIPTEWIRLAGPTSVNTANNHLTRLLVEYDADVLTPTYILQDIAASATAAGAILMDGPSAGVVGVASTNFTVSANGTISGSVIVTPNDNGGGGAFTPTTVTLSSGAPSAPFTYTPASSGVKTISATNNGGLTNPADIPYVSNPAAATAVTMSGPTTGSSGVQSTNFTVGANGAITGSIVVTPHDASGGGTFAPTSVTISGASPTGNFTYTPGSTGTKTISVTNDRSLTNPSNISYVSTGAAAFFEDDLFDMTGTLDGRTPSISNANGKTYTDPGGNGFPQFGAMLVQQGEGFLMEMTDGSYRLDITAQMPSGGSVNICCKDNHAEPSHLNYQFDMFALGVDDGVLEYWNVGPSWDIFDDIATVDDGAPIPTDRLVVFSLVVDDDAHTAQFLVDNVARGSARAIRSNARVDWRVLFGPGGAYVTHIKCS